MHLETWNLSIDKAIISVEIEPVNKYDKYIIPTN